eukprot:TRINITY_DN2515_c0_g1_i1.p1 TRINITY_DN2515_c0_g1~~TRINITY_DN2515_c0_g1_i1.p1  ORF type:complete len:432 (-),score=87.27 TRINITY_DN2515_c0_g1_i1:18-1313(-)
MPHTKYDTLPETTTQPVDKYNLVWFLCVIVGVGHLYSWNAFISAYDYYVDKFPDYSFIFYLPIANGWGTTVAYVLFTKYGPSINLKLRLYSSYFVSFLSLVSVYMINETSITESVRMVLSLVLVVFSGITSAVLIGSSFGVIAALPPEYTGALMSGQGLAGVFVGVLKLLMNFWWFPIAENDPNKSTIISESGVIYFGISSWVILICSICTAILMNSQFYKYHQEKKFFIQPVHLDSASNMDLSVPLNEGLGENTKKDLSTVSFTGVIKKIWVDALSAFIIFVVTLSLFPGFTVRFRSYDESITKNYGVILITLFQVFDFIGRTVPKWITWPPKQYIWIPSWSRVVFYVFFMFCTFTDFFPSNYIAYFIMILFSLSNGYLSTLAMMNGPTRVDEDELETAGILMGGALQLGVLLGSHLSILLLYIATGKIE